MPGRSFVASPPTSRIGTGGHTTLGEFQALLKARPAAGNAELGGAFSEEATKRVWGRPLGADELRSLRAMKARRRSTKWPARASPNGR